MISRAGHDVRLVPPDRVKPFVKKGKKNDAVDAAAICMAASHPDTMFVPIKSEEQQGVLSLHSTRALLVKQQTMLSNALRALASEFGLIAPLGTRHLPELMTKIEISADLPATMKRSAKNDDDARRLMTIPGVGPITASLIVASVADIGSFASARHFAAWLGLVPRQYSTGGKTRLRRITKTGNRQIRPLLVLGATAMLHRAQKWDALRVSGYANSWRVVQGVWQQLHLPIKWLVSSGRCCHVKRSIVRLVSVFQQADLYQQNDGHRSLLR
ncbi:Transposase for insertion sequence element IS1328 (plasmid) [Acetobacter ascendens]|uniref:Transposase for insertion sequence element IS1328 n=1 Tax=Acetobacter ascendens TaxID=481146 RepID=A0A1Y0V8T8_9PROT|nr:Transposase for insertion sequence element IS1328 [Acetobacter ascendens]